MTLAEKSARGIKRVLVIFPGALGDLVCFLPALGAIARRHRGASVELMARFELGRLVVGRSVVARAHSIDAREVGALFTDDVSDSARGFFSDFDRIYSFFASDDLRFRARLVAATDGVVSFHPFRPGGEGHVAAGYLRAIGEADSLIEARIEPTAEDLAGAVRILEKSQCDSANLIVIFPGSGSADKNWAADKFAALAAMVAKRGAHLSYLVPHPTLEDERRPLPIQGEGKTALDSEGRPLPIGGEGKTALDSEGRPLPIPGEGKSCVVVLGPAEATLEPVFRESGVAVLKELDLPIVAAVARLALAFVGNDSGVSHLAAAVGASGVVLFGPTDPARWRPLSARGRIEVFTREPIDSIEMREVAAALSKFVVMA
jgi:heptosyltransferase III